VDGEEVSESTSIQLGRQESTARRARKFTMKLIAEITGTKQNLEIRRDGARVWAEIDGRLYELEAHEPEAGVYLLMHGGGVYECRVETGVGTARGSSEVSVRDSVYEVALIDPKRLRGARGAGAEASGRAQVAASMPGKVVRVLVAEGAQVEAGDGLVVVEAMKMQNELKSPKSGTVVEVRAEAGATVNAGDVLVVVE
jgi:biotin carboxyl carrier protein